MHLKTDDDLKIRINRSGSGCSHLFFFSLQFFLYLVCRVEHPRLRVSLALSGSFVNGELIPQFPLSIQFILLKNANANAHNSSIGSIA
ncbi:hypothetical protein KTT_15600 [Tengunoibacter tsumagoiensis]|uniref:Uncharacterized protein n=1 Tax=Tengunoibacter tsumagoiensis TaxID=2014871 RepID=A0A401ZXX8_9CHLR|nr:hypothetical protein KTT_15600 [Tengunoibacter tsumagoiensis]